MRLTTFRHRSSANLAAYYRPRKPCWLRRSLDPHILPASYPRGSAVTLVANHDLLRRFRCLRHIRYLALTWFRLPGGSLAHTSDPARWCFAALSDPLLIQDRRFIQQHGGGVFLSFSLKSTTALIGDLVSHPLVCG